MNLKKAKADDLNAQLQQYGAWMRANGRRNIERAKQISSQMQLIREELARRAA